MHTSNLSSAAVTPQDVLTPLKSSVAGVEMPAETEGGCTPRSVGSPHIGAYRPDRPASPGGVGSSAAGHGRHECHDNVEKAQVDEGWTEVRKSPRKQQAKAPKKGGRRAGSGSSKPSRGKGQARVGNASTVLTVPRKTSGTTS